MSRIRLAIDASGGDYAPDEITAGAILGARQYPIELTLVGQSEQIEACLSRHAVDGLAIDIVDAPETIELDEDPVLAVRKKKDASIVVCCELVHEDRAEAVISMGHAGAGLAAALFTLGRLPGVDRPGLIVPYLGFRDTYLIDAGANTEVLPQNMLQFAIMGSLYVERVIGITNPLIGLLSNGSAPNTGNAIGQQVYALLQVSGLNFIGNVEGFALPQSAANVIVTDGFTGDIALKLGEGLVTELLKQAEETAPNNESVAALVDRLQEQHIYARSGAAPVLGINGLIFIGHSRSKAPAVAGAIGNAIRAVEGGLLNAIRDGLKAT
ncbi:MAG TPA: phosphate acyltransferase PlsX [Anaerolineae bacterium]